MKIYLRWLKKNNLRLAAWEAITEYTSRRKVFKFITTKPAAKRLLRKNFNRIYMCCACCNIGCFQERERERDRERGAETNRRRQIERERARRVTSKKWCIRQN